MNKETLALILVMGIAGVVILLFVAGQQVYGYHVGTIISTDEDMAWLILMHVLEEEKKQTALLDHIDCMQYENVYSGQFSHKRGWGNCGQPLNYTGVWNP